MKRGVTLIELLISAALGAILLFASFWVISNYTRAFKNASGGVLYLQTAARVLAVIEGDIVSAKKIGAASSSSALVLEYPGYSLSYDYNNRKVRRVKGKSSAYLTDSDEIQSLYFSYSGNLVTVKADDLETRAFCRN